MSDQIADWAHERSTLDTEPLEVATRILRAAHLIQARLDAVATTHGLSHKGDLDVLTSLRRSGPPYHQTPSWLARGAQLTTGGMTNRLDRLEHAGLVAREPDPDDRRGVFVCLTEEGMRLADTALEDSIAEQRAVLSMLNTNEQAAAARILQRLLIGLGDTADPAAAYRPRTS